MARFWFALALLLASCDSPKIGEVGAELCRNHKDDDHDGREDCDDPDCHNQDVCLDGGLVLGGAARDGGGNFPDGGLIGPPLLLDSGTVHIPRMDSGMDNTDEDGGSVSVPVDAGVPQCVPACPSTAACIDGKCTQVSAQEPGLYTLHIDSAVVPDASPFVFQCYDISCPETSPLPSIPNALCSCPVDPYVLVTLTHAGGKPMTIGSTTPQIDTDTPNFDDPAIDLKITSGDVLRFEVYDKDDDGRDDLIFSCPVDLTNVMPGMITCMPAPNYFAPFMPQVNGTLSAKIVAP